VSVGAVTSYTFTNVQANHTIDASFAFTVAAVSPVTALTSLQKKTGNDTDGTTKIQVSFTAPGGTTIEVYRKGFGGYPKYDDAGGSVPTAPGAYPPAGWTLTAVTASGQFDEPATRDYWYYVAYAKDACGNVSPASSLTSGSLNYHLGDVTDGITPGQGDNSVSTVDLSLLGAHYGATGAALTGFEYLDVGPTTNTLTSGRPTTDSKINFEDLVMFAINYTPVASALASKPAPQAKTAADEVGIGVPGTVTTGESFDVPVVLSSAGDIQALSVALKWNPAIVTPTGATEGDLVSGGGIMLQPSAGTVDAAMLGGGNTFAGTGSIAIVHFQAIASGDPALGIQTVTARDPQNAPVAVSVASSPLAVPGSIHVTELQPVMPNPARNRATVAYSLAKAGPVDVAIYSVDGRLVKTLAHGTQDAGRYQIRWDGTDERGSTLHAGTYFVRLHAGDVTRSNRVTLVP